MSAAAEVLDRLASLGASVARDGDRLILRAGQLPVPADIVATLKQHKPALLDLLAEPRQPPHDTEERAAIIEEGAGVPRKWAEGVAQLSTMPAPAGVPVQRWRLLIDNAGRFIDRWATQAATLGWDTASVFGCHAGKPHERIDVQGLVWLIGSGEVIAITSETAAIRTAGGPIVTYRRRQSNGEPVAMAWEIDT